ncbi:MAG TPA: ABC transporter substrate-binding protein [Acidimicrobiales bacterium]|nr:ABC transporter substrate-binding protein [Acidimicrobiales bacterium]
MSPSDAATAKIAPHAKIIEGLVTAFTGAESFIGGVLSAGVYPATESVNAAGGVLGHKMGVVTVDTRGDPADALPLVERFLGSQKNLVGVTGSDSATMVQLAPLFNSAKLPMNSQAGSSVFDVNHYKYFWRDVPPDATNGIAMALWAKKQGYTKIALVFGTDATAQGDLPGILAAAKLLHLTIVDNIGLTPDQPSYQSQAATLLADNPQVIMTEEDATTAGTFFGDLAQLGTVPPIEGDSGTVLSTWMSAVSSGIGLTTFENKVTSVTSQAVAPNLANRAYKIAVNKSASKLVKPASQWYNDTYSEACYDGVIIQALAMQAAKSVQPTVYNAFIRKVSTPGRGIKTVYTFAQGKSALARGQKIDYVGTVGAIVYNKYGNYYGNQAAIAWPTGVFSHEVTKYVITAKALGNA